MEVRLRLNRRLVVLGGVLVGLLLGFIFRPGMPPFHNILWGFYVNPILWILSAGALVGWVLTFLDFNEGRSVRWLVSALLLTVALLIWWGFMGMVTMGGLYQATDYQHIDIAELPAVVEPRPVSFAEARQNFRDRDNDPRRAPHDLDFVRGEWVSDFSPEGGLGINLNRLLINTSGFFVYNLDYPGRVRVIKQEFPWAEGGWLWNGLSFHLHQVDPFMEFHEVLYLEDPETGEIVAATAIIKRAGLSRYPYLAGVWLLYQDGSIERLSVQEAIRHPLLGEVQVMPEWLARKQAQALSLRTGILGNIFTRNKIEIQDPKLNRENHPPYHLKTEVGMMWFTPFTPAGATSMTGVVVQDSHNPGVNLVYERREELAWTGVDSLASLVYAAHPKMFWVDEVAIEGGEGGKVKAGNFTVQELLPAFRREGEEIIPYFIGYVTPRKAVDTLFYCIVRADTREVGKDFQTIEEVRAFLRGEFDFVPVKREERTEEGTFEQQLLEHLQRAQDELDRLRELVERR